MGWPCVRCGQASGYSAGCGPAIRRPPAVGKHGACIARPIWRAQSIRARCVCGSDALSSKTARVTHYHAAMHWIDGHLDLAYLAVCGRDVTLPCADPAIGCVSLPDLHEGGVEVAFATIFTEPGEAAPDHPHRYASSDDLDGAERAGIAQLEVYESLERRGLMRLIRRRDDVDDRSDGLKIVLLMEGADPIRSPEHVASWHQRGMRMIGLTWATGSRYAGGNERQGPLTALGRELVAALDAHGVIHDASHLADAALADLLACAVGPIVASHSNCRALLPPTANQRHLRDDQIIAIERRGGIIGLNLFTKFLVAGRRAEVGDCVRHVERVCELTGHRRGVALGSDMDGGFGPNDLPAGLDHPAKLVVLSSALRNAGWSEADVAGFARGNWLRFLRDALPASSPNQSSLREGMRSRTQTVNDRQPD
jgi:membrane dipeptidase